jgi:hypothetical protein
MCATEHHTCLENRLKNVWKLNNRILIKCHTGDSAEMGTYFGGPVLEI